MDEQWTAEITVSGMRDEPAWSLFCEPEGAVLEIEPGDVLALTFSGRKAHGFEVSRVADGVILCRLGDSDVKIDDKRWRELRW